MTPEEFEAWKAETAKSQNAWRIDPCHDYPEDTLIYRGGESGHYIMITLDTVSLGTYEGAIPHIGEALFTPLARLKYRDNAEAWQRLGTGAKIPFLAADLCAMQDGWRFKRLLDLS